MRNPKLCLTLIILLFSGLAAETSLSGTLGSMTLDREGSPYKVHGEVLVSPGKTLTIREGTVLLFSQFSGIEVRGKLIVEGTSKRPVVFTSANDQNFNDTARTAPEPYDWNGIRIMGDGASAKLSNFIICYSVFGINSQVSNLFIQNGIFHSNGLRNLSVNGDLVHFSENFPFDFGVSDSTLRRSDRKSLGIKAKHHWPYLTGSIGLFTVVAAVLLFSEKGRIHREYISEQDVGRMGELLKREREVRDYGTSCIIAAAVSIPVSTIALLRRRAR